MRRSATLVAATVLAAPAAVVASLLGGCGGGAKAEAAYVGSRPPAGVSLPSFELAEAGGPALRADDLNGKIALVTFLDTHCHDACPLIADRVRDGLALLEPDERSRVVAVAISVHPHHDTPSSVAGFLASHRVERVLHYLTGSEEELRPVWTAFAVQPSLDTGDADLHSAPVQIYDARSVWVSTLTSGVDLTPENLAHDVRVALGEPD